MKNFLFVLGILLLQSCAENLIDSLNLSDKVEKENEKISNYTAPTNQLNKTRELLDGASISFPTLTATGYAVVST